VPEQITAYVAVTERKLIREWRGVSHRVTVLDNQLVEPEPEHPRHAGLLVRTAARSWSAENRGLLETVS
jgi:hypothetical protein